MVFKRTPSAEFEKRLSLYLQRMEDGQPPDAEELCEGLSGKERRYFSELVESASLMSEGFQSPLQRGRLIAGRYVLEVPLGAGGFGTVWRASDRNLDREVAVKFLSVTGDRHMDLSRFQREVQALVRTDCRGVAQVHDIGTHEGSFFIVMEYVEGRSLAAVFEEMRSRVLTSDPVTNDHLRTALRYDPSPGDEDLLRGHDRFRSAARICVAVLRAVEAVHGSGIRHRDIKPSNVMLRGGGTVALVDFGLAATSSKGARSDAREGLSGSLPFLAPEQLRNLSAGTDGRTDVYQVGLLLYEFCTLRPAFEDCESPEMIEAIQHGEFPAPRTLRPEIPGCIERICMMALANDPRHRYQTAEGFRTDLERWLGGRLPPVAVQVRGGRAALLRLPFFLRRHSTVLLVLLGICIGGLLVGFAASIQ